MTSKELIHVGNVSNYSHHLSSGWRQKNYSPLSKTIKMHPKGCDNALRYDKALESKFLRKKCVWAQGDRILPIAYCICIDVLM